MQQMSCKKYPIGTPGGVIALPSLLTAENTADSWPRMRRDILSRLSYAMGMPPADVPLRAEVCSERCVDGIAVRTILLDTFDADRVRCLLLLPPHTETDGQRHPAILALHPTDTDYADSLLLSRPGSTEDYPYALELARAGYVVLAPDVFTRQYNPEARTIDDSYDTALFESRRPEWSTVGRMLGDHRLALRYLLSLPCVDGDRLGTIGHSLGGTNAMVLAAMDARIKAVAVSCCLGAFCCHHNVRVWCREKGFCYFPQLKSTISAGYVPFEWFELIAAASPRPYFIFQTKNDRWFPRWDGAVQSVERAAEAYALQKAQQNLVLQLADGPHCFPRKAREAAYAFLRERL